MKHREGGVFYKAKELRKNMTPQERKLWYCYLKDSGIHWNRQKVIGGYIADFYCHSAKLIIELDGLHHYSIDGQEYDTLRTKIINTYEIKVFRFLNYEIDNDFKNVCMKIADVACERMA